METLRSEKDRAILVAFTDFDPAKLAGFSPATPLTIRSLAIFAASDSQTLIYVGTGGGKLILLSLNPSWPPAPLTYPGDNSKAPSISPVQFLRSATVSNRVIESINVLPEIGKVLLLSDGFLFLVDPLLLEAVRKLEFVKDVTAISKRLVQPGSSISDPFGDGAVRAELSRSGQTFFQKFGGIRVNGTASRASELLRGRTGCFLAAAAGKKLVLIEFFLPSNVDLDAENGGISIIWKEIQGIDQVKTMAWVGDSIIVGTSEGYTLIDVTGKGSLIFSLPESSSPLVISLVRSYDVLLLFDNVGIVSNALGHPVGGSLIFQSVPESITEMHPYVIVARDDRLDLYRKKTGVCVQSLPLTKSSVGPCIVVNDDQGSGEIVVIGTAYKAFCCRKVSPEEQIKDLLKKKHFKEAIYLVEEFQSEGEMTREMLSFAHAQVGFLLLFELHFEEAVDHFLLSESMDPSEIFPFIMRDPNRWSHLVPRKRYWGLHPPPVPLEQVVDDGLMAIQRAMFLKKAGFVTATDEDFILNPPSRADLLQSAIENIIRYLLVCREKGLLPSVKEGVDTLLIYLYRALNHVPDMEKLASSQNSCVVEELESLLDDSGHLRTLAFLYASKGMYSKALNIWRTLAKNYSTGFWKDPTAFVDYSDSSSDVLSSPRVAAAEASKLLQESSDQALVLEHLGWIADIDQECAILILTSDKRINQLSPEKVIASIDPKKDEIHQRYLQWLIEDQGSEDTQFHTLYALSLARSTIEFVERDSRWDNHLTERSNEMSASDVANKGALRYLVRERLQLFLQASDLYGPEAVLKVVEGSELWLEKAILYRKMGLEELVLEILALKLEDCEAAEQYCAEIGRNDAYMQLLDMYLDPQDGKGPMFKAAVRLLHNHGESLDPLQLLEKLSPEMPLQLASDIVLRMLRARVHHHHQGQIVHNLSRAISLDTQLARLEERSRNVQINDESICDSCHARLGTKLFAMYPDDSIVCYKCYRRLGESTSARGRNYKENPNFKPGWLVTRDS